ncbi:MAG TPA: hypothetical protein VK272_03550 [Solirubrobacteraceae bacterium]|nr:hypothetical protein [Solirubrobacteraceae bacterium]
MKLIVGAAIATTLVGWSLVPATPAAYAGESRRASTLATTSLPSPVSAVGGVVAWVGASGRGHRFQIVIRSRGHNRALSATSAVGWIDGVKLGTDAHGRTIVVYSRCPYKPYGNSSPGHGGTDGCRLWWAPTAGGAAHLVRAAPPDASTGQAVGGSVVFAVQPNSANLGAARVETARLSGNSAQALPVPHPKGASIEDISASSTQVAFIENSEEPTGQPTGLSQIWLDEGNATPKLIAHVRSDDVPIDESAQFFDGLTLSGGYVYTSLYAQPGLDLPGVEPHVTSRLERISLADLSVAESPWEPDEFDLGVNATSYDPTAEALVVSSFSRQVDFSAGLEKRHSCPIEREAPVAFAGG